METRPLTLDEAELRLRRLLAEEGYPQPDEVRSGPGSGEITFVWEGYNPVTLDLADYPESEEEIEERAEQGKQRRFADIAARMSMIIAQAGLRKPDLVLPGPESYEVSFIWEAEKVLVIVDSREELEEQLEPLKGLQGSGSLMV